MSKPEYPELNNTATNWDAILTAWRDILTGPIPLAVFTSAANAEASYPAAQYEDCIVMVDAGGGDKMPHYSDGTDWLPTGNKGAAVNLSTATDVTGLRDDLNTLIQSLKASDNIG